MEVKVIVMIAIMIMTGYKFEATTTIRMVPTTVEWYCGWVE